MHKDKFVRGKGRFIITQYVATDEKVTRKFPLLLTTGRILSQYNVGAQTRRTPNNQWHSEDRLEIHPHDAEDRGIKPDDWVGIESRAGETVLRATVTERMQPGVVYTTFHFPESGANVITTDSSDWATNCPEYKVTAVQVMPVAQPSEVAKILFALQHAAAAAAEAASQPAAAEAAAGNRPERRQVQLNDCPCNRPAARARGRWCAFAAQGFLKAPTGWPKKCRWRWSTTASRTP
jgi:formate dehydrogenase major subunit